MSHNDWTNNFLDSFEDELLPEIEELEPVEASDNYTISEGIETTKP